MNKKKLFFIAIAITFSLVSFALKTSSEGCGVTACGGGDDKCCTDKDGNTFYRYAM